MRTPIIIAAAAIALASGLWTGTASAQSTPGIDRREHFQAGRIYRGIQDGSLTFREAGRAIHGQARIRHAERRFRSDGVVTPGERLRLHRGLNRQSRRIFRFRHN